MQPMVQRGLKQPDASGAPNLDGFRVEIHGTHKQDKTTSNTPDECCSAAMTDCSACQRAYSSLLEPDGGGGTKMRGCCGCCARQASWCS